jgi:hypothetical protein
MLGRETRPIETRRRRHPVAWLLVSIPALLYVPVTMGLWRFPGCPPDSLEYPGHVPPTPPLAPSLILIACIWVWFVACAAASLLVHGWLRRRPQRWLRVASFVVPGLVALASPVPCLMYVALASLC